MQAPPWEPQVSMTSMSCGHLFLVEDLPMRRVQAGRIREKGEARKDICH